MLMLMLMLMLGAGRRRPGANYESDILNAAAEYVIDDDDRVASQIE